jgi:hypothetical protein
MQLDSHHLQEDPNTVLKLPFFPIYVIYFQQM